MKCIIFRYGKQLNDEIIFIVIYRYMNTNENNFRIYLCEKLQKIKKNYQNKCISIKGDIQINILKYINNIKSMGLMQTISNSTKISNKSSALINVFIDCKINIK